MSEPISDEEMAEYWAWVRAGRPRDEAGKPVEVPVGALSRPVSAQDDAAGVDGRGGQGQDDTGRLTGVEDGR